VEIVLLLQELNKVLPGGLTAGSVFIIMTGVITFKICDLICKKIVEVANIWRDSVIEQNKSSMRLFEKMQDISNDFLRHNEALAEKAAKQYERSIEAEVALIKSNDDMIKRIDQLFSVFDRLLSAQYGGSQRVEEAANKRRASVQASKRKGA